MLFPHRDTLTQHHRIALIERKEALKKALMKTTNPVDRLVAKENHAGANVALNDWMEYERAAPLYDRIVREAALNWAALSLNRDHPAKSPSQYKEEVASWIRDSYFDSTQLHLYFLLSANKLKLTPLDDGKFRITIECKGLFPDGDYVETVKPSDIYYLWCWVRGDPEYGEILWVARGRKILPVSSTFNWNARMKECLEQMP